MEAFAIICLVWFFISIPLFIGLITGLIILIKKVKSFNLKNITQVFKDFNKDLN